MHDVIIRRYKVILMPDAKTSYDPITVSLSYSPEDAAQIGRTSTQGLNEAFNRAVAIERSTNHTPNSRAFLSGGVTCIGEKLVQSDKPAYNRTRRLVKHAAKASVRQKAKV